MTPEQAKEALSLLKSRDGRLTVAKLTGGRVFRIMNIAWGRDDGAEFDHVTTNISPAIPGFSADFFSTADFLSLMDEGGNELLSAS